MACDVLQKAGHGSRPVYSGIAGIDYKMAFDVAAKNPDDKVWLAPRDLLKRCAA